MHSWALPASPPRHLIVLPEIERFRPFLRVLRGNVREMGLTNSSISKHDPSRSIIPPFNLESTPIVLPLSAQIHQIFRLQRRVEVGQQEDSSLIRRVCVGRRCVCWEERRVGG